MSRYQELKAKYDEYCTKKLNLTMARGNPSTQQIKLSQELLTNLKEDDYLAEGNIDCRNYGQMEGIPEMKRIFSDITGFAPEEIIIGGNSSLNIMFDNVSVNMHMGPREGKPWAEQGKVKFLCPSPGYDRHFSVTEYFNVEMIPIQMTGSGPNMDAIEKLTSEDPMIKGIWCVPIFSNPTGETYSDETVRRFASLKAAPDFRIFWDNAYCVHNFRGERRVIPNILRECEKAGNPDRPIIFTSFSKIGFPGNAVAMMASSKANCAYMRKRLSFQTIGPDKLNQLRYVRFFKNAEGVYTHMKKHAEIIGPKFELVNEILEKNLKGKNIASWTNPDGGYFISFDSAPGCAKRIVELCKNAGLTLTGAGSCFPLMKDPEDRNIRIAPSFPPMEDLRTAMELFCIAAEMAALELV